MNIRPLAPGAVASANPREGMSASAEKVARAKAVASGKTPESAPPPTERQVDPAYMPIPRIKLRTQRSPDRHMRLEEPAPEAPVPPSPAADPAPPTDPTPAGDTLEPSEPTAAASEETKPLSPQFAALAKQKRALQLREQEVLAKEKALTTQEGGTKSLEDYRARIKANALSVLLEEGVTYDQLTEQILASNDGAADISELKAEIKALKEGFDTQTKTLSEKEATAETHALAQIQRDADQLISEGEDFEMIREAGYAKKVTELIHKTWKKTGEVLDVNEAATLIENELLSESLKFAKIKKVQSRLNPTAPEPKQVPVQNDRPNTKIMRTLTNRDGSSSISMSKRERAIAAMEGRLTK